MTQAFRCQHFSIGLPTAAEDQSLSALFKHVGDHLAQDDPISMDDIITIGFETDLGDDAEYRGVFTVVFADPDSEVAAPA